LSCETGRTNGSTGARAAGLVDNPSAVARARLSWTFGGLRVGKKNGKVTTLGLAITVGILSYVLENDPEATEWIRDDIGQINRVLSERGLPIHEEPSELPDLPYRGYCASFPYSMLQRLREVALHEAHLVDSPHSHLLWHADNGGYYVPISFSEVISDDRLPGQYLGSTVRLFEELVHVAPYLGIPLVDGKLTDDIAKNLEFSTADSPEREAKTAWFALYECASASLATGAAVHFG
jgi:hypothetical protein